MKLKNIFFACLAGLALTSCSNDEDAFFTVSENDAPRILNTDFPEAGFNINRNEPLKFEVLVTPADMTTVTWQADGKVVFTGNNIDQVFEAGDYTLKIVATTTKGKETSRTMRLTVKPIDGDPIVDDDAQARIQAPGDAVTMNGSNLTNIKKVRINDRLIDITTVSNTSIQFTMPADMPDGQYRLSLLDEVGQSFGGGLVTVFSDALITKGDFMGQSEGLVTMPGRKLNDAKSVTVNGQECSIESITNDQIVIKLPALEEGVYDVKATTKSGAAIKFLQNGNLVETASIKVSLIAEEVLWEGTHSVDWSTIFEEVPLCTFNPVKTVNDLLRDQHQ